MSSVNFKTAPTSHAFLCQESKHEPYTCNTEPLGYLYESLEVGSNVGAVGHEAFGIPFIPISIPQALV